MKGNTSKELIWLLSTVLVSMVAMFLISWQLSAQLGWTLRPGGSLDLMIGESAMSVSFNHIAMYVFAHLAMLVYTGRLWFQKFKPLKLNLIMLVVYGYMVFGNFMLTEMLYDATQNLGVLLVAIQGFSIIALVAIVLASITLIMLLLRLWQAWKGR